MATLNLDQSHIFNSFCHVISQGDPSVLQAQLGVIGSGSLMNDTSYEDIMSAFWNEMNTQITNAA